jgi:tripartite-type tricarboxylate transporter receptor subunit TctC
VTSLIQGNRLCLLAVSTEKRLAQYPNVPTIDESGLKNFFFDSWFAMVLPAGTPKAIVERLNSETQELGIATKAQFELYRKLIQDNNIKSD